MDRLIEQGVGPEFLLSEAEGRRSRDNIVVGFAQSLRPGRLLTAVAVGALAAAAAPAPGNAGAATITAAPSVAAGTPLGRYVLTATTAGATAQFTLQGPDGVIIGVAVTGTPATLGGIGPFTITDAGTDPAVGDRFVIDVTAASIRHVGHTPGGPVSGVLYDAVETGADETADAVQIGRDAEVIGDRLDWTGYDAGPRAAAEKALEALGVIVR